LQLLILLIDSRHIHVADLAFVRTFGTLK